MTTSEATAPARGPSAESDVEPRALEYGRLGYGVFALKPNTKEPATRHGLKDATTDPAKIARAFRNGANLGLLPPESVLVLDVDEPDRLPVLLDTFPELGAAPRHDTPRGGAHLFLRLPEGRKIPARTKAAEGLDLRGMGRAYLVAPPSAIDGRPYTVTRPLVAPESLPETSAALLDYLHPPKASRKPQKAAQRAKGQARGYGAAALADEAERVRTAQRPAAGRPGNRNDTLNAAAFSLGQLIAGDELNRTEVEDTLTEAALAAGLEPEEIRRTLASAITAGMEQPRSAPERPADMSQHVAPKKGEVAGNDRPIKRAGAVTIREAKLPAAPDLDLANYPLTDAGNAERLLHRHGHEIRHTPGVGWLLWNGKRWERDTAERILQKALWTMRATDATAAQLDGRDRNDLSKHARSSESANRLRAMVDLARTFDRAHTPADRLDSDPWLLNTETGLLDLRTATLKPHEPAALCTKLAPVTFDLDAEHEAVTALLDLLDRDGRAKYLRDVAGQALAGRSLKAVYVAVGPSGTAKTTYADALMAVLGEGEYAVPVEAATISESRANQPTAGAPRADLVALRGARLAVAAELPNGGRLSGELLKRLTSGDPISAKAPYAREMVTFRPGHTLLIHTNHEPRADWTDDGLKARLRVIPFRERPERPDPRIRQALVENPDARAAFLAWAVVGAVRWHKVGEQELTPPAVVTDTTREYWKDQDPFSTWAEERLDFTPDRRALTKELTADYRAWAEANSERPASARALGLWLGSKEGELGISKHATNRGKGWAGVGLRGQP